MCERTLTVPTELSSTFAEGAEKDCAISSPRRLHSPTPVGGRYRTGGELATFNFAEFLFLSTPVNEEKRKRLPYILSTQLLPQDVLRQELAGCILL